MKMTMDEKMCTVYAFEIFNVVEMCLKCKEYQKVEANRKKSYEFLIILWFPIAICLLKLSLS